MKKKILCLTFIFAVVLSCSLLYINASEPVGRVEQNQAMLTPAPPSPTPPPVYNEYVVKGDFEYNAVTWPGKEAQVLKYNGDYPVVEVPELLTVTESQTFGTSIYVTHIMERAFADNLNMNTVMLPKSIQWIESEAFAGCTNLETVFMASRIRVIDDDAFKGCNNISTIYFTGTEERFNALTENGTKCKELLNAEVIYLEYVEEDPEFTVYLDVGDTTDEIIEAISPTDYSYTATYEEAKLYTGSKVLLKAPASAGKTYGKINANVVIRGDVTGDGDITSTDYMKIKRMIRQRSIMNDLYSKAADYNGDRTISSNDYFGVKRAFSK